MIVADTNLVVHLVIPGDHTPLAEQAYRKDPNWSLPVLWQSEFRNTLTMYVRAGRMSLLEAVQAMARAEILMQGGERRVRSDDVLHLASQSGCSAYDCEFVALAQALGVLLVTSDRAVLKAFPYTAVSLDAFAR